VKFFASQWRTVSINSNSAWLNLRYLSLPAILAGFVRVPLPSSPGDPRLSPFSSYCNVNVRPGTARVRLFMAVRTTFPDDPSTIGALRDRDQSGQLECGAESFLANEWGLDRVPCGGCLRLRRSADSLERAGPSRCGATVT